MKTTTTTLTRTTYPQLQVGDVIWRERKGWNHGARPFVVFQILNDREALAVPTSTTNDLLGCMPAIKAGNKAAWINPLGMATIKRNRYPVYKTVGKRELDLIRKAFNILKRRDAFTYKKLMGQVKVTTTTATDKDAPANPSKAWKAWKKQIDAITAWEKETGKTWPHRIPQAPRN